MQSASFSKDSIYHPEKVRTELILETSFSKEIRIMLAQGQSMKEHTAPFPIVVHLLKGEIDFGVNRKTHHLTAGDILTLEAKVPHDLHALKNSVVRLTLSKQDKAERVADVAKSSK